jgi:hypothetical protein
MTKLDLALINEEGHDRTVPVEMELHLIKYFVGERIREVEADPNLLTMQRSDNSDIFYASRTHLNRKGWDTSIYNDKVKGGSERRKKFYDKIKFVCENYYGKKRHMIGLFPDDRAVMSFKGEQYAVNFDSLSSLMSNGTDVIFVEKQGTVIKMMPFAQKVGVAYIDSQGFGSEYGVALAELCDKQAKPARDYTRRYVPIHRGNLASLTDCDASGINIGMKVNGAVRLGVDLNTIKELNDVNPGLGLKIEDLQEGVDTTNNTHFKALMGLIHFKGKFYEGLLKQPDGLRFVRETHNYLLQNHTVINENGEEENILFIDWLRKYRIELNKILAVTKPKPFWKWLKWKLEQVWPERNYNRTITIDEASIMTPTMKEFTEWYNQKHVGPLIKKPVEKHQETLSKVKGFYEDVDAEEKKIDYDLVDNTLLKNKKMRKIDLALKLIMSNPETAATPAETDAAANDD